MAPLATDTAGAPGTGTCPFAGLFAPVDRRADAPDGVRARLRAAGPVVRVDAPAGGPVWVVTEETLARAVLNDPRVVKDTALAPADWDPGRAGLEPPATAQLSLTTADGPTHAALRRAHAPLFTPRRMREYAPHADALAVELLAAEADAAGPGGVTDLVAGFTARFPAAVVLDVVGAPPEHVDAVVAATHDWFSGDPQRTAAAMGAFLGAAAAALSGAGSRSDGSPATRADLLGERMPAGTTRDDLLYALFGVIFAGQLTTEAVLADVLAAALTARGRALDDTALAEDTLRRHAPAALSLWRFTAVEIKLAGQRLPARSPILVDLRGLGAVGADLAFGAGPHHCLGAALARVELLAAVRALRGAFPGARLACDARLRRVGPGGAVGEHLAELPVILRERAGGPLTSAPAAPVRR